LIRYYKSTDAGLETLDKAVPNCWINVVDPTTDEIEFLAGLDIPQDFITYPLDIDERSRIEREDDGTTLILIRVPYFQGLKVDVPYTTLPLGLVLTDKYIVTICRRAVDVLQVFSSGKISKLSTAKRNRFVLRVLLANAQNFLNFVREINKATDLLEDALNASMRNNEVLELLKYQKSLVYFTTALKTNELTLVRLQRTAFFKMYPDDEDLLEDVITENQQAIEMTNISENILTSTMDAFASIISNNLNGVMKFLASVTIVISLPTIVTGFFGMNVPLPLESNPMGYLAIIGIIVTVSVLVTIIFMRRDWF
jgi:magnesium transporter